MKAAGLLAGKSRGRNVAWALAVLTLAACAEDEPFQQETVPLAATRELRGVWVASVHNINFPSVRGASADAQRAELDAIIEVTARAGLNAIFLQIRPESDALYASSLEPWSRYLTGTQGGAPDYDPLEYALERAHDRGLELHAWLNPFRARATAGDHVTRGHISVTQAQWTHAYAGGVWMDPGAAEVRAHVLAVIEDLVTRYDLDGVHFDDYFYPYPDATPYPDQATYAAYRIDGGELALDDWRRDNVNTLVREVGELVHATAPWMRFGISPFGIYRPGIPAGITGLDQYAEIYADPVAWMENGWVDYLAPQLYWPTTKSGQEFAKLVEWWASIASPERPAFAGCYLAKLSSSAAWTPEEFAEQVRLTREAGANARGNIFYHVGPLLEDRAGIVGQLASALYARPARPPGVPGSAAFHVAPPTARRVASDEVELGHSDVSEVRAYALYGYAAEGFELREVVPAARRSAKITSGTWAVSALSRAGAESVAVVVR